VVSEPEPPIIRRFLAAIGAVEVGAAYIGEWVAGWRGALLVIGGMLVERVIGGARRVIQQARQQGRG
jgi:hypothetical protein